jgi:hypothetical protein
LIKMVTIMILSVYDSWHFTWNSAKHELSLRQEILMGHKWLHGLSTEDIEAKRPLKGISRLERPPRRTEGQSPGARKVFRRAPTTRRWDGNVSILVRAKNAQKGSISSLLRELCLSALKGPHYLVQDKSKTLTMWVPKQSSWAQTEKYMLKVVTARHYFLKWTIQLGPNRKVPVKSSNS